MHSLFNQPYRDGNVNYQEGHSFDEVAIQKYLADMEYSIRRQYAPATLPEPDENDRKGCLRVSSLGKPAVLQLLMLPHIVEELEEKAGLQVGYDDADERRQLIFHLGDWFEAWFSHYLHRQGFIIMEPQKGHRQWTFNFHGVEGHGDIVAYHPSEPDTLYLVECKCMNSYGVRAMVKDPWGEKPEYVTQAAVYGHCLQEMFPDKKVVSLIVAFALDPREIHYIPVEGEEREYALRRAEKIIQVLPTIKSFNAHHGVIQPPPGERLLYRGKPTTTHLVIPRTMKWVPDEILSLFYNYSLESVKVGSYYKKAKLCGEIDLETGEETTWYNQYGL